MHAGLLATPSYQVQNNPVLGRALINPAASFLDTAIPLSKASHGDVVRYSVETIWRKAECIATLADGCMAKLCDAWQFIGYTGRDPVKFLLFCNNGLHIEVQVDDEQPVVAVGADDKLDTSRDCLSLMRETLTKFDNTPTRALNRDRTYTTVNGNQVTLPRRSA